MVALRSDFGVLLLMHDTAFVMHAEVMLIATCFRKKLSAANLGMSKGLFRYLAIGEARVSKTEILWYSSCRCPLPRIQVIAMICDGNRMALGPASSLPQDSIVLFHHDHQSTLSKEWR